MPPFTHGLNVVHAFEHVEQVGPVQPPKHEHVNGVSASFNAVQAPPFKHGSFKHGFAIIKIINV